MAICPFGTPNLIQEVVHCISNKNIITENVIFHNLSKYAQ